MGSQSPVLNSIDSSRFESQQYYFIPKHLTLLLAILQALHFLLEVLWHVTSVTSHPVHVAFLHDFAVTCFRGQFASCASVNQKPTSESPTFSSFKNEQMKAIETQRPKGLHPRLNPLGLIFKVYNYEKL